MYIETSSTYIMILHVFHNFQNILITFFLSLGTQENAIKSTTYTE